MEASVPIPRSNSGEPMRCPNCGSRLIEVDRSEILIDACPSCRGVWLDRGELDKILVRERELAAGDSADDDFFDEVEGRRRPAQHRGGKEYREYDQDDYGKRGRGKRKRRNLLESLLDFD